MKLTEELVRPKLEVREETALREESKFANSKEKCVYLACLQIVRDILACYKQQ